MLAVKSRPKKRGQAHDIPVLEFSQVIRINQFLPHLHRGDAIGDSTRLMARCFEDWGYEPAIYCYGADPGLLGKGVRLVEHYRPSGDREVQVLHYALPSPLSSLMKELPGKRILVHHNLTPARFFAGNDPEMVQIVQQGEEELRRLAGFIDLGLADSEWNRRELLRFGYGETGVQPILIDWRRYRVAPRPGLLASLSGGMFNLLFVGRLAPNKQQEELLKVVKLFQTAVEPRTRLLLVGKPDRHGTYASGLLEIVRQERIQNVHFAGYVDHEDLCTYYRASDLFLSTSGHEGFCVPLLEAFYFDLPVVALASSAIPWTLGGAGIGFSGIAYPEVVELVDRIRRDGGLRERILERQRARLRQFSTNVVAETLRRHLEKVL